MTDKTMLDELFAPIAPVFEVIGDWLLDRKIKAKLRELDLVDEQLRNSYAARKYLTKEWMSLCALRRMRKYG